MADSSKILINILTRTSNRPNGFYKCYTSIKKQSYKNVRHIVSYDNKADLIYLEGLDVDKIYVGEKYNNEEFEKVDNKGNTQAIYNLYCNDLLDEVKDGWVLFLDDDNYLYHNKVLEEMVDIVMAKKSDNSIFIWQMRYPNGVLLPSNSLIESRKIKTSNIDSSCFLFHSKFKDRARWDQFKVSDFRFLEELRKNIPEIVFVKKVFVQVNNFGDLGARNDIMNNRKTLDYTFNKNLFWPLIPKAHYELFGIPVFQIDSYKLFGLSIFKKDTYVGFKKNAQRFRRIIMNFIKTTK